MAKFWALFVVAAIGLVVISCQPDSPQPDAPQPDSHSSVCCEPPVPLSPPTGTSRTSDDVVAPASFNRAHEPVDNDDAVKP